MSEATVKAHVSRLLSKLDVTNRVQIAILVHDADPVAQLRTRATDAPGPYHNRPTPKEKRRPTRMTTTGFGGGDGPRWDQA